MPLVIDLKPGEKVIINGAVIENSGSSSKLRIHNQSNVLKQKEIMTEEDAKTPASRVYFCLQCAYIFPGEREKYMEAFATYLKQYVDACPSAAPIASDIVTEVTGDNYYKALRCASKLLKHEKDVFGRMNLPPQGLAG